MKVIEIETLKSISGHRVIKREDFESVVDVAGHYVQTIEEYEVDGEYRRGLYDYICEHMQGTIDEYVEKTSEDTIYTIIDDLTSNVELPKEVQPFTVDTYVELDSKCKSLYYVDADIPNYNNLYENCYKELEHKLLNMFEEALVVYKEVKAEKEAHEALRQSLIRDAKEEYKNATTKTKKDEVIGQLKVKLAKEFNEKHTKDDIIYELEN